MILSLLVLDANRLLDSGNRNIIIVFCAAAIYSFQIYSALLTCVFVIFSYELLVYMIINGVWVVKNLFSCHNQVYARKPGSRILACAPQNDAADLLTRRLIKNGIDRKDIIRLHALSRPKAAVEEKVSAFMAYCIFKQLVRSQGSAAEYSLLRYEDIIYIIPFGFCSIYFSNMKAGQQHRLSALTS